MLYMQIQTFDPHRVAIQWLNFDSTKTISNFAILYFADFLTVSNKYSTYTFNVVCSCMVDRST